MPPVDRPRSFLPWAKGLLLPAAGTLRLLVPAVLLAAIGPLPSTAHLPEPVLPAPPPLTTPAAPEEITSVRREVRLRKLHLVRPDLIQYPLSYDVYC